VYLVTAGPCSVDSATAPVHVHVSGAGTCTVTASQPGSPDWEPAADVARSFAIAQAAQTIAFPAIADRVFGGPFEVHATSSAGRVVSLAAQAGSACTVSGSTITPTDAGECTIVATQAGNTDYLAAASVTRTFTIRSSTRGSADASALKPATGGNVVFHVRAGAPGATLTYVATTGTFGRPIAPLQIKAKSVTAFGLGADGRSAWFAGVTTEGQKFRAYVADAATRGKRSVEGDVFLLWVGGVVQTGDGTLEAGKITIAD
jgi:O-acetyl-ADP-ribose deacetylase (regulator of RNase III)